ncbi:MAG: hypothetical protein HQ523_04045 [Lentisphaerae bacterium]|nr:hypothetical protein [Lentisphaerota bacterium]
MSAAAWVGVWGIVTENGSTPAENGYRSIVLTLTETSFTSMFDAGVAVCSWSGPLSSAGGIFTTTVADADGPPCNIALGTTRSAAWSLSNGNSTLTLNWMDAGGTLQVYARL